MATFYVTSTADDGPGTLRTAIKNANDTPGNDIVSLSLLAPNAVIRLDSEIEISDVLTLQGGFDSGHIISGDMEGNDETLAPNITDALKNNNLEDNTRLFVVGDVDAVVFNDLTLTGGFASDGEGGGAIFKTLGDGADVLVFQNTDIVGNTAKGADGGAIKIRGDVEIRGFGEFGVAHNTTFEEDARGGAIYSNSRVLLVETIVHNNRTLGTNGEGGAIHAYDADIVSSTLFDNRTAGNNSHGGAVAAHNAVVLQNATLTGNGTHGAYAHGGAVASYFVTADHATVTSNSTNGAVSPGGGISAYTTSLENSIVLGNFAYLSLDADNEIAVSEGNLNTVGGNLFNTAQHPVADVFADVALVRRDSTGDGEQDTVTISGGALSDNGGRVPTVALHGGATNPALDEGTGTVFDDIFDVDGNMNFSEDLPLDARGLPRDVDIDGIPFTPDIGAFELQNLQALPLNFTVTTADDELDATNPDAGLADFGGANDLSLREAMALANHNPETADVILFDPAVFTGGASNVIRLDGVGPSGPLGEIEITGPVEIDASGVGDVTITGDAANDDLLVQEGYTDITASRFNNRLSDNSRLFNITEPDADTTFDSLTLTGGFNDAEHEEGGAIFSVAPLTLDNSAVLGNGTNGNYSSGGGIYAAGELRISSSRIEDNFTFGYGSPGGGFSAANTAIIADTRIQGNATYGDFGFGGGGRAYGPLILNNNYIAQNFTMGGGAGGGGISSFGSATISRTEFVSNGTSGQGSDGGGLDIGFQGADIVNSTFSGNSVGGTYVQGGGFSSRSEVRLANVTLYSNFANGANSTGGAGYTMGADLVAVNVTASGNRADGAGGRGGAFASDSGIELANSIVLGNSAATAGTAELFTPSPATDISTLFQNIVGADQAGFDTTGRTGVINAAPADVFVTTFFFDGLTFGSLANNGGDVETVALLVDPINPALDAGFDAAPVVLNETVLGIDANRDGDTADLITSVAGLDFDARGAGFPRLLDDPAIAPTPGLGGANFIDLGAFEAEVQIGVNSPPVAVDDTFFTDRFTPIFGGAVLNNDSDPDGDPIMITGDTIQTSGGRAFVVNGTFIDYAPLPNFTGVDSFDYQISDGEGGLADARVEITVNPLDERDVCARIVAYLYEASLDRFPDLPGVNFWIDAVFGELPGQVVPLTKEEIADFFLNSPEFEALIGADIDTLSDQELVEQLFLNTLDRPGDPAGVAFWVNVLATTPGFSRADMLLSFAQSPENVLGSPDIAGLQESAPSDWDFGLI